MTEAAESLELPSPPRELTPAARRYVLRKPCAIFAIVTLMTWGLYICTLFNFDLLSPFHKVDREDFKLTASVYAVLAVIVPLIAAVWAVVNIRRGLRLARHGIEVPAKVLKVGMISAASMVRVDYQYAIGPVTITKAMSCLNDIARRYEQGIDKLVLLVDPKNPKVCGERDDIFKPNKKWSWWRGYM